MEVVPLLPPVSERVVGQKYLFKGDIVSWNGKHLHCIHGKYKSNCKECGGSALCQHGIHKFGCRKCGGNGICNNLYY